MSSFWRWVDNKERNSRESMGIVGRFGESLRECETCELWRGEVDSRLADLNVVRDIWCDPRGLAGEMSTRSYGRGWRWRQFWREKSKEKEFDLTEEVSVREALMRNVVAGEEGERDRVNWVTERNWDGEGRGIFVLKPKPLSGSIRPLVFVPATIQNQTTDDERTTCDSCKRR